MVLICTNYNRIGLVIIIIIMLSKILLQLKPAFARTVKSKKPIVQNVQSIGNKLTNQINESEYAQKFKQQKQRLSNYMKMQSLQQNNDVFKQSKSQSMKIDQNLRKSKKNANIGKAEKANDKVNLNSPLNRKMKQMHQSMKSNIKRYLQQGLKQEQILKKFIPQSQLPQQYNSPKKNAQVNKTHQPGKLASKNNHKDTNEQLEQVSQNWQQQTVQLVKQQMLISQIIKARKQSRKKNKKNKNNSGEQIPIGSKYQQVVQQNLQQKQQRILQTIQEYNKNKLTNTNEANQMKQLEQSLSSKYPSHIIQAAKTRKVEQLSYFKQLIKQNDIKQYQFKRQEQYYKKIPMLDRRLNKNQSYQSIRERDQMELERIRKQKTEAAQYNEQLESLQSDQIIRKIEQRAKTQQLVQLQNQQYYLNKGLKQYNAIKQIKNIEDIKILEAGQQDRQQAGDLRLIMMDEIQDDEENNAYKKQLYDKSTFGMIDRKMQNIEKRLKEQGIQYEIEELKGMKKQLLFNKKKQRQEMQRYQKYLQRKQKKQKMKQYMEKIHKQQLREDLDFNKQIDERFKDFQYDPLDIQKNIAKMKQLELQRKSVVLTVSQQNDSQIHFKKTQRNISNFILDCFYRNLLKVHKGSDNQKIVITSLKFNQKKTVANVFWKFQNNQFQSQSQPQQQKKAKIGRMQKNLQKSAGYISGKMTQLLGFRYGPQIRFYYDIILPQTKQIKQSLQKSKQQVVEYQLKNLLTKGHIKTEQQMQSTRQKLLTIADDNIRNYHNRNKLLSKKYRKEQRQAKSTENVVVNKKKAYKPTADERFWQHVDKL